ncbi:MAG: thioredoxin family protein [Thermoplasmatota archaeon]
MRYILYHATWCPFCRSFAPRFRKMMTQGEEVLLEDHSDPRWIELSIDYVPTVIAMKDGKEVKRLQAKAGVGITEEMFRDFVSSP